MHEAVTEPNTPNPLLELIQKGATVSLIARLTGHHENTVRRDIRRLCLLHNITYEPNTGGRGNFISKFDAHNLEATKQFRHNCNLWLLSYAEHYTPELTKEQLARATGLTTRVIARIKESPYDHDWSIIQLSRFADSLGVTFSDLMMDCTTRTGFKLPVLTNPNYPE